LTATLAPAALALPRPLLELIPPRPPGYGRTRELFPRYTGGLFDAITPAIVAAEHTVSNILTGDRAARLVEQHALDQSLPGLDDVIAALYTATFDARTASPYEEEIRRAVERVVIDDLMQLAASSPMSQVRAIASHRLQQRRTQLAAANGEADTADAAHYALVARDIERFLERPMPPYSLPSTPAAPPGAPIGEPAMDWIGRFAEPAMEWVRWMEPFCSWEGRD
jgi:hypothetical protein